MKRVCVAVMCLAAAMRVGGAEPEVAISIVDAPVEFSEVQLELRIQSDSYIILHSLELALSKEMDKNRVFQERDRFANQNLFTSIAHTDAQRQAAKEGRVLVGEPERWNRVAGPARELKVTANVPKVVLGRAGPTRIRARLLYEPIEKLDLAGAQVKGPQLTHRVRSADAAVKLLAHGEWVLLKKDRATGQVDAELVVEVTPRQPSFAQVSQDEGRRPFWYWDGLWLFEEKGVVSGLSPRGERFVWENVDPGFFRFPPVHGRDSVGRRSTVMIQIDGDVEDFKRRFPDFKVKTLGRGGGLVVTHLKTETGDRGVLDFSEQLSGSGWRVDVPAGIRRFRVYKQKPRIYPQERQILR